MLRKITLHPLFLAVSPVLALYATNIREIEFIAIARSILFAVLLAGVVYLLAKILFRKFRVEALLTSILMLVFFSFGHIQKTALTIPLIGSIVGRSVFLIPVIMAIVLFAGILIIRNKQRIPDINSAFNIFALILVIIPLAQIGYFEVNKSISKRINAETSRTLISNTTNKPNIYYIILDSYARQDELLSRYQFDNSGFIQNLRSMGFYVADCSLSNYSFTPASIGSTLNMDYMYNITSEPPGSRNTGLLFDLVPHNRVRQSLEQDGYKIVGFDTNYNWMNWYDADIYYGNPSVYITDPYFYPFETLLIDTSILRVLEKHNILSTKDEHGVPQVNYAQSHIKKTKSLLGNLKKTASIKGPIFVYAHILVPHAPYIFNPDGSANWDNYYDEHTGKIDASVNIPEGYVKNIQFINNQMNDIIKYLLDNSDPDPIIIIQGDHAMNYDNRYPILNAYYFPDKNYQMLYPSISPVNSFRVIFDKYFGSDLPLLKDISLTSDINKPFGRMTIDAQSPACKSQGMK